MKLYDHDTCTTCKKARSFLDTHHIGYERVCIKTTPPSLQELQKMLSVVGGVVTKLCNTSGILYRELKIAERLPNLSLEAALTLLSQEGMLIKRPFLIDIDQKTFPQSPLGLIGFKEELWEKAFSL